MHPLGYRKPREQMSTTIPEDALLHDSTAEEHAEEDEERREDELEAPQTPYSPAPFSPAPIARVLAREEDDQLGLDDEEPVYYDSDE